jgi:hypothetical protein
MAVRGTIALPPVPDGPDRPVILVRVYPGYHEQAVEGIVVLVYMAATRPPGSLAVTYTLRGAM